MIREISGVCVLVVCLFHHTDVEYWCKVCIYVWCCACLVTALYVECNDERMRTVLDALAAVLLMFLYYVSLD